MTRIIAIANQKGGVGKTTTTINLAYELVRRKQRVLVVDLDPQAGLTMLMGLDPYNMERSSYSLLMFDDMRLSRALHTVTTELAILPGSIDLAVAGVKIIQEQQSLNRLRKVLRSSKIAFDYVLIDTPPTLDVMTAISMVAADEVLIPAQCHYFAMVGIRAIKDSMHRIRDAMRNPELKLRGVLPTMLDTHSTRSQTVLHEMRAVLGREVLNTVIPYDVTVMDAPHQGKPVVEDAPESPAGKAYRALVDELLEAYLAETPVPSTQSVEGTPVVSSPDGLAASPEPTADVEEDTAAAPTETSTVAETSEAAETGSDSADAKPD